MLETVPEPPEGVEFSITANKGIIESADTTADIAITGLVGKRFDGGIISDYISSETSDAVGSWIEGVLGRTRWGA